MKVFGIVVVRNEADVIRLSLLHHLGLGLDTVLVLDNASTDGTAELLERMSRDDPRIRWSTDAGLFYQVEARTALAREALRQGADWVVPFDADEFWWVKRGALRDKMAASTAGALYAPVINFIQRRDQLSPFETALLTMTRRPPRPIGLGEASIDAGEIAFIEMRYPPKCVFRPTPEVVVEPGNHDITGAAGPMQEAFGMACLHAPLRNRASLERKAEHGLRALETGSPPDHSWHLKRWARLGAAGSLEAEWAANSYEGMALDVYGTARPVVEDTRLRDLVAPFVTGPPARVAATSGDIASPLALRSELE